KSPPAAEGGECRAAQLAFGGAGTAGNLHSRFPLGQHQRRPYLMDLMGLHRPCPAALGAISVEHRFDLLLENFLRNVPRHAEHGGIVPAFLVAVALRAGADATHDDSRPAISTLGHKL